jgi:MFS family permease
VVRRVGSRRWGRSLFGVCGMSGAALLLLAVPHCDAPLAASLCTGLALLGCSAMMTTWWSVVTEISGRHVGAVFGLANSLALPGAVAGPLFMGFFVEAMAGRGCQSRDQWDPAFYAYAGVVLAGAVGWLFIDATRSVVTPPQPSTPAGR